MGAGIGLGVDALLYRSPSIPGITQRPVTIAPVVASLALTDSESVRWIGTRWARARTRFTLNSAAKRAAFRELAHRATLFAKVRLLPPWHLSMRAIRYQLELSVRFRPAGESAWRDGLTQNVSTSGVLFHASTPLAANTPVEVRMALPLGPAPNGFSEVICNGHIVRTIDPSPVDERTGLAVAISDYKLVRGSREPIES